MRREVRRQCRQGRSLNDCQHWREDGSLGIPIVPIEGGPERARRTSRLGGLRARPIGGDGRVYVLGRWSHSVSTWGRGVLACPTSCAEPIDGGATFTTGDEVGCPKRAQRNRRFEPGIVVCHPGDGSPVWDGSRWGGASFPFKNTRLSGSHLCPSWYRSPARPSSSPRLLQPGRRDRQVVAPLPGCQRHGARLPWPLARCWVRDGFLALEGVWCAVSLFGLFKAFRGSGGAWA